MRLLEVVAAAAVLSAMVVGRRRGRKRYVMTFINSDTVITDQRNMHNACQQ